MAATSHTVIETRLRGHRHEEREFKIALALGFIVFLIVAIGARLLPRSWRPQLLAGGDGLSVIGEARRAAHIVIPFAFMR